jgi:membrane protease YdiL (CAAX protease family)
VNEELSMRVLLIQYSIQLAVILPIVLILLWLLRHRWQAHLDPQTLDTTTAWRQALLGAGTAVAALLITLLPGLLAGAYDFRLSWQAFPNVLVGAFSSGDGSVPFEYSIVGDSSANAGTITLLFLIQSLFEEALFRGIGLALFAMLLMWIAEVLWLDPGQRRFSKRPTGLPPSDPYELAWRQCAWLYSGLTATAVLSIGFGLMHRHNPDISPIALLNIMLAGLWLGLLFWKRVSLLAAWLAHFAWNATLALLGLPISGWAMARAPLGFGIEGAQPGLLTGGSFGPEASIPCTIAFSALTTFLAWRLLAVARVATAPSVSASDSDTEQEQAG